MSLPKISNHLRGDLARDVLKGITTVLFDADGVLWNGPQAIPGSKETFNKLVEVGKRVFIITNNSTKSREQYKTKCEELGFQVSLEQIVSTSYAAAWYLNSIGFKGKVHMLGNAAMAQELDNFSIQHTAVGPDPHESLLEHGLNILKFKDLPLDPDVKAVLVGFDSYFNYVKIMKCASYIVSKKALFVATNEDAQVPIQGSEILMPGTGVIVNAVSNAAGRKPDVVVGKPHATIINCLAEAGTNFDVSNTLMVGDRMNTDMLFAKRNGIRSVLTLTGINSLQDVCACEESDDGQFKEQLPTFYVENVGSLAEYL